MTFEFSMVISGFGEENDVGIDFAVHLRLFFICMPAKDQQIC